MFDLWAQEGVCPQTSFVSSVWANLDSPDEESLTGDASLIDMLGENFTVVGGYVEAMRESATLLLCSRGEGIMTQKSSGRTWN